MQSVVCHLMIVVFAALGSMASALAGDAYDLVLQGGRVIDPETGLDAVRDVAISSGRIAAVSEKSLSGTQVLDVSGLVVSPGFIDLHNHSPTPLGLRYQALDGVTTSLELEAGFFPLAMFAPALKKGSPLNIGASTGYASIRMAVKADKNAEMNLENPGFQSIATAKETEQMRVLLQQGLESGGLGIGLPLDYMSEAVNAEELRMVFEVAGERKTPVFVHIRRGLAGDPAGLQEVLELARLTGAPLHICHLQHSAMKATREFLALIQRARKEGVDVTTEMFPYNAGTTFIGAAVFKRNWQEVFDISYEDVEWAATGERFDKATWEDYQQRYPDGMVIHHYVKEEWTKEVLADPQVIIVTDGTPVVSESIGVPPQGIGSYARVLGHYVREEGTIDLVTAITKMTLLPARRLEDIAPVFSRKGRIQVGADADITVFDAEEIIDHSTYSKPFEASSGVKYLLVNGDLVVREGEFQQNTAPGQILTTLSP